MDHKRWIAGLVLVTVCFGLVNMTFAETRSLYENVQKELAEMAELEKETEQVITVQPGDTVFSIAKEYGTDVQTITKANRLSDPSVIHVGDELRIPLGKDPKVQGKEEASVQLASRNNNTSSTTTSSQTSAASASASAGKLLGNFTLTAYTAGPESTGKSPGHPAYGITASGKRVQPGVTIAADPNVIPMGSRVYIEGVGTRIVHDTGGAIKGNRIDVYIPDLDQAIQFGVKKDVKVYAVD